MGKPDINIVQDLKFFQTAQTIVKPIIDSLNRNDNLNINVINIQVQGNQIDPTAQTPKQSHQRFVLPDVKEVSQIEYASWMQDSLFRILEALPQPRHCNLIRLMIKVAYSKFEKKIEAAKWLGMGRQAFYQWTDKFNLRTKYTENAVEKLENRLKQEYDGKE